MLEMIPICGHTNQMKHRFNIDANGKIVTACELGKSFKIVGWKVVRIERDKFGKRIIPTSILLWMKDKTADFVKVPILSINDNFVRVCDDVMVGEKYD